MGHFYSLRPGVNVIIHSHMVRFIMSMLFSHSTCCRHIAIAHNFLQLLYKPAGHFGRGGLWQIEVLSSQKKPNSARVIHSDHSRSSSPSYAAGLSLLTIRLLHHSYRLEVKRVYFKCAIFILNDWDEFSKK